MAKRGLHKRLIGDVLKRVPLAGVPDIKVPTDIRRVLVANIENLRENAVDVFAKEISKVLARIDVHGIVEDVLKNYSLRLEARIDLVPKRQGTKEPSGRKARK